MGRAFDRSVLCRRDARGSALTDGVEISNAAFSVVAMVWGGLTGCFALMANTFWAASPVPSQALMMLSILIGPAAALAGIALAWLGFAQRRIGLTLAGPVVTATAPMAAFLMLAILEKSLP